MTTVKGYQQKARNSQVRWMVADLLLWIFMLGVALWVRQDLQFSDALMPTGATIGVVLLILTTAWLVGWFSGLYSEFRRVWPGSHTEIIIVFAVHACAALVGSIAAAILISASDFPFTTPLIAGAFVIAVAIIARSIWRWLWPRIQHSPSMERVMVLGSGTRAFQFLSTLPAVSGVRRQSYLPVAVFAEDNQSVGDVVHGLRALPMTEQELEHTIDRTAATTMLLVTDDKPTPELVSLVKRVCDEHDVRALILPGESDLAESPAGAPGSSKLREISISDLIGREPVQLDETQLRKVLEGRRVLVTGAGGSIGSELCRQVHRFDPAELILLDRDEGGLHATELSLSGTALLDGRNTILADIRDAKTLRSIFEARRPEVVFHAAALKHQPLLEKFPTEAVQTNVIGTQNVLEASAACGAEIVVNVSTDKAANPTSALGESKRIAERLTAQMATTYPGVWVSVRFGNVFGSRGSVIHTFTTQIEAGGPVTVTDRDVERFFMTIPEASQLVLQAAAVGHSGETLVLEMGEPVRIADLARSLISLHGREGEVEIAYTGLRPGEKISEELVDDRETPVVGDRHELITEVTVSPWQLDDEVGVATHDSKVARRWLTTHGGAMRKADSA